MSSRFRFVFFVRFLGYFIFLTGLIGFIFMLGPLLEVEVNYRIDKIRGVKRIVPEVITAPAQSPSPDDKISFAEIKASDNNIIPVSTEYGIVIEKINANAKIIPNVNPGDEKEYVQSLTKGVASALGSTPPGQPGNLYLFSHSTDAPWNIIRFNAIFYLLRELEKGDKVIIFFHNKRFDYIVYDKTITKPTDISFLTNKYDVPTLTLQTCDPPGTLINRLIVRARLVGS